MNPTLLTTPAAEIAADLVVVPLIGGDLRGPDLLRLDRALHGQLLREIKRQRFRARENDELLFQTHGALPARDLLLVGTGAGATPASWYRLADTAARASHRVRARRTAVALGNAASPAAVGAVAEGFVLADYSFTRFRSQPERAGPVSLVLSVSSRSSAVADALARSRVSAAATRLARDLVNTPAGSLTPADLAHEARRLAGPRLRVRVYRRRDLRRLRMGALLGVAQGSSQEPRFIECVYRPPGRPRKRIALVGKGITFDSGGLSLKTAQAMQTQKRDMAGSAVILGVMSALPELRPPLEVRGYIPATENMPGGGAIKPGDIVRAFNGKTIEVLNTDAEGRLVLADALAYAATRKPDLMLDFATLTAAVTTALGNRYAAIMGTNRDLVSACIAAAAEVDEKLWELPLPPEYRRDLDSQVADLKNTGEGTAGSIIGGLFLREFVGDVPWAHVDFSSTAVTDGHPCHPKGATGFGVRTVLRLLSEL